MVTSGENLFEKSFSPGPTSKTFKRIKKQGFVSIFGRGSPENSVKSAHSLSL
jgi:hypothetical protein